MRHIDLNDVGGCQLADAVPVVKVLSRGAMRRRARELQEARRRSGPQLLSVARGEDVSGEPARHSVRQLAVPTDGRGTGLENRVGELRVGGFHCFKDIG